MYGDAHLQVNLFWPLDLRAPLLRLLLFPPPVPAPSRLLPPTLSIVRNISSRKLSSAEFDFLERGFNYCYPRKAPPLIEIYAALAHARRCRLHFLMGQFRDHAVPPALLHVCLRPPPTFLPNISKAAALERYSNGLGSTLVCGLEASDSTMSHPASRTFFLLKLTD